jgi:hypothetical protein
MEEGSLVVIIEGLSWFMTMIYSRSDHEIERIMLTQETQKFLDRFKPPEG